MANRMIEKESTTVSQALGGLAKNFCIGFTLLMLFSMIAGMIFASDEARAGIIMCWELAAAMLVAALLQMIFFTPLIIRRMGYLARIVIFGICLYVVLVVCAVFLDWFPAETPWAWMSFTVTYLAAFAVMSLIFTAIYRRNVKELNEHLSAFRGESGHRE